MRSQSQGTCCHRIAQRDASGAGCLPQFRHWGSTSEVSGPVSLVHAMREKIGVLLDPMVAVAHMIEVHSEGILAHR